MEIEAMVHANGERIAQRKADRMSDRVPFPYGSDYIFVMIKDPKNLYAYWEVSAAKLNDFRKSFGPDAFNNSCPALKVWNITRNTGRYIKIDDKTGQLHIGLNEAGCVHAVEVGRLFGEDFFISFARSNTIKTPYDGPSQDHTAYFTDYRKPDEPGRNKSVHGAAPFTAEDYERIYAGNITPGSSFLFSKDESGLHRRYSRGND